MPVSEQNKTTPEPYAIWHAELRNPTPPERRQDRPTNPKLMSGRWRIENARTKPDTPVAIWTKDGDDATIFQFGAEQPRNTVTHDGSWQRFVQLGWLKAVAVTNEEWARALETGHWDDGKPSREMTEAEKADIIPTTPASEGGNAPEGEDLAGQIDGKVKAQVAKAEALGDIDTLEKAQEAAPIIEELRRLFKLGDAERDREKRPHDEAAKAVQAKWLPIITPAKDTGTRLVNAVDAVRRAEEARLRREAEQKAAAERERLRKEAEEQARREAEERAKQIEAMGIAGDDEEYVEAEIAAAGEAAAAQVQVEQVAAPRVGTAYGKGIAKPRQRTGKITDVKAFALALIAADDADIMDALQKRANALARSKVKTQGMEIVE